MKNIQIIDGAVNAVYDIFQATSDEFNMIFPDGTDVAFVDEVYDRHSPEELGPLFDEIWKRRIPKKEARGIHGILFYEGEARKEFYPTRRDEEALNPDGTRIR